MNCKILDYTDESDQDHPELHRCGKQDGLEKEIRGSKKNSCEAVLF